MGKFQLWPHPWWVNLLLLIPAIAGFAARRNQLPLTKRQLFLLTIFGAAFGFVEAAVVVYLRAVAGLLPGYTGSLALLRQSSLGYEQAKLLAQFPQSLLAIEMFREAATLVMLAALALLAAPRTSGRWIAFLWTFAMWDISYYASLWTTVRWPASLEDVDVLFLIPVPWVAQVWFPLLVSSLTIAALALSSTSNSGEPR